MFQNVPNIRTKIVENQVFCMGMASVKIDLNYTHWKASFFSTEVTEL
jgi:hypothetical protein